MKVKVSEATGPVLDWMVAKAEGLAYRNDEKYGPMCFRPSAVKGVVHWDSKPLPYSSDWSQGGPIIEREGMVVGPDAHKSKPHAYAAVVDAFGHTSEYHYGPTPLIAAMRCFVASKLGDEVDVPKELTQ